MAQIARNTTDDVEGFFKGKRYLIHDRDPLYTHEFLSMLADAGIESVKLPPRSPNLNAYAERFVRSIKEECLEQMILFGEDALRNSIREFLDHFHQERNHQGLRKRLISPDQRSRQQRRKDRTPRTTRRFAELLLQGGVRIGLLLPTAAARSIGMLA